MEMEIRHGETALPIRKVERNKRKRERGKLRYEENEKREKWGFYIQI